MGMKEYIDEAEKDLLHTYNRYQVVLDHGKGVNLYDTNGKEYLDFMSGIGVYALGYGNKEYNDALKAQIDKITHTSNLFYNVPAIEAAKKLKAASGMDRVFFTNSGAEAVEGAIKTARKYAYRRDGKNDHEIIALEHSFHGRTMGALSVTGKEQYRTPFEPMIGNIKFAEMNDLESVTKQINQHTCAILFETVQGEGGVHPATPDFIKAIRKICDKNGLLMMLDEVQCGMGRTGSMFAYQKYGVKPDVVMSAKALGCGVPVGAFMMTEKIASHSLEAGDHGTTYGGGPFACAAVSKVLDLYDILMQHDGILMGNSAGAVIQLAEYHLSPDDDYPEFKYYEELPYLNDFYMEVHYEETTVQDESIQRVLAERGKTVYATAVRSGAILVDNGNLKLLGDVKVFGK